MLTVVEYRGNLFYVTSSSMSNTDGRYIDGLGVDTGNFKTLYLNECNFQYFVDDKGHKLDSNLKPIKEEKQ